MNIFSIEGKAYQLTKENYIQATNEKEPYFKEGSHFAVCPCCGNPIQIINLFKEENKEDEEDEEYLIKKSRKIHGRHLRMSIIGVAKYDEEKYKLCKLQNPIAFNLGEVREKEDENEELRKLIERNKNNLVNDIREIIGISFEKQKIEEVIQSFLSNKNYRYRYTNEFNIPYAILYTEKPLNIYGQKLNLNSEISNEISLSVKTKSNFFKINEEDKKIEKKEENKSCTGLFLIGHRHRINNKVQFINIRIFEECDNNKNIILEKIIKMKEFIYE